MFDRYFYNELAFKHIYGCPHFVLKMLYANTQIADIPFYIKLSPQICQMRNRARAEESAAIYQDIKEIKDLSATFDIIAAQKSMVVLNGSDNTDKILEQIILR